MWFKNCIVHIKLLKSLENYFQFHNQKPKTICRVNKLPTLTRPQLVKTTRFIPLELSREKGETKRRSSASGMYITTSDARDRSLFAEGLEPKRNDFLLKTSFYLTQRFFYNVGHSVDYIREFLLPKQFLLGTNPSVYHESSLTRVVPGIFQWGADSSKGARMWLSGYHKCQSLRKSSCSPSGGG